MHVCVHVFVDLRVGFCPLICMCTQFTSFVRVRVPQIYVYTFKFLTIECNPPKPEIELADHTSGLMSSLNTKGPEPYDFSGSNP